MIKKKSISLFFITLFVVFLSMCLAVHAKEEPQTSRAKYIFLFIGDGMGVPQRTAAELYLANTKGTDRPEKVKLLMNTFPVQGITTTYDLTSVIPDSASTGTAIATGYKTASGVVGMDPGCKIRYESIAKVAKRHGLKVGILSTVSLDHATPAVFYANVPHRNMMYEIGAQLVDSGFNYFAGGQLLEPVDKKNPDRPNIYDLARAKGYTIAIGRKEFQGLRKGMDKVIAMNQYVDRDAAMYYTIDQKAANQNEHISLAELVAKGIELLYNPKGFFMMVEGGKIDWACHANDAAASIHDVIALDEAVAEAVKFYKKHPKETIIIVTGDHETGGMTIGFAGTQYSTFFEKIRHQKMSYIEFDKKLGEFRKNNSPDNAKFEDILPLIREAFGLYVMPLEEKERLEKIVRDGSRKDSTAKQKEEARKALNELKHSMALTDIELNVLREAFKQSMAGIKERAKDDYTYLLYGGYEPLTVKLTTILNNKAGIGWTSYSHTGAPVPVSALGVGASLFNGYYDQTGIHTRL
ncbi:MAG TPA: alkaline phosphatase, partial [Syntrophorhabdaceae bacterium]|nr:alkaline phosphatase [Syntrophorhabdaceae bacterium]